MHAVKLLRRWWPLALILLRPPDGLSRVLEVPVAFPTIQSALDSSAATDTIRVAPGIYHEFLLAPYHSLTMTGWYPGDTLAELRATLDPIPAGADTPSAAVFGGDSVSILNFAFYNRPEYREYNHATRTGGVHFNGRALHLENCRFDSVSRAVREGQRIYLRNCIFDGCFQSCVSPDVFGILDCRDCSFDGDGIYLVRCESGSVVRNCAFLCSHRHTEFLMFHGSDITITDCRFGPCYTSFPVVSASPIENCLIENCVFEGIDHASSLISVFVDCGEPFDVTPLTIRGNTFVNYHGVSPAAGTRAISINCEEDGTQRVVSIERNLFQDGSSNVPIGVGSNGTFNLIGNRFVNLLPENIPDVRLYGLFADTVRARGNEFLPPGLAALSDGPPFDARYNWWGDSTGPYNSAFNPAGQGTEVGNTVLFIPWLTEPPDSLFDTSGTSGRERVELPTELALSVFPNPFNPHTTISFTLAQPGLVQLELFNVLGRHVTTLADDVFSAGPHDLRFDGSKLTSGVYLARLTTPRASLVTKLLLLK